MQCPFTSEIYVHGKKLIRPCNRCIACRVNKTMEWSTRLVYENESHDKAVFISLTYDPEFLPENGTLVKSDVQKFMKRVRKHYFGNEKSDIRYYGCGEYGPSTFRPHYHLAIFGVDFEPETWIEYKPCHFFSPVLRDLWPFGFNEVGFLTANRMNYVTGYIQKKQFGDGAKVYEERGIIPPFQVYSKNLGVEALKRDASRLTRLFISDKGKPIQKYYSQKLALNEYQVQYTFEELSPYASTWMTLSEARARDRAKEERAKYPNLSDAEYAKMLVDRRLQKVIDYETRAKMLNSRGDL